MSTTIFRALKKRWPEALVDVLLIPETAPALKNNPYINTILTFNKRKKINKLKSFFPLINKIRNHKYDLAFSVQSSLTSALIMWLSGIKIRVGYEKQKLLTNKTFFPSGMHSKDKALQLLQEFSDKPLKGDSEVFPSASDFSKAKQFTENNTSKKKIAIAPASVWATKKWPHSYFIELIKKGESFSYYLIGGKEDKILCDNIIKQSGHQNIMNCAGELSILESCALIKEMDLLICNDSAPLHMANAVNTPVFALFGPTVKDFGCYPYREADKILEIELECRPCSKHGSNKCPKGHHKCMIDLRPESVIKQIEDFFSVNRRTHNPT